MNFVAMAPPMEPAAALQHVAMACVVTSVVRAGAGSREFERALAHSNFRVLEHGPGATGVARVRVRAHIYRAGSYM